MATFEPLFLLNGDFVVPPDLSSSTLSLFAGEFDEGLPSDSLVLLLKAAEDFNWLSCLLEEFWGRCELGVVIELDACYSISSVLISRSKLCKSLHEEPCCSHSLAYHRGVYPPSLYR